MTTALAVSNNAYVIEKIRVALKNERFKVYEATSKSECELTIRTVLPAIVFVDIDLDPNGSAYELINSIKSSDITKEVSVIALSINDQENLRELSIARGADFFVPKPFFAEEILSKARELLSKRGKFTTSYTARFARSLINYTGSSLSASRIVNMGHQICRALEIDMELEKDILQAARILACSVKDGDSARIVRFFEEMGFAQVILAIMKNSPKESLPSAVLWALYINECEAQKSSCKKVDFGKLEGVYTQIKELYESAVINIENPVDLNYAKEEFFESFALGFDQATKEHYHKAINKILIHMLIYHDGAQMFKTDSRIVIKPKNRVTSKKCLERIACKDSELDNRIKRELYEKHNAIIFELSEVVESKKESMPIVKIAGGTISARDFVATNPISAEELEDMKLLEDDMFELLEELSYSHSASEILFELNALLANYGSMLMTINEFSRIAQALIEFSFFIRNLEALDQEVAKRIALVVSALIDDLTSWRRAIFVDKNASDIHFMDDSIVANCNQCLASLKDGTDENRGGLELF